MFKDYKKLRLFFGVDWIFCESKEILNQEIAESRRQGRKFMYRSDGARYWLGLLPEGDTLDGGRINIPAAVVAAQLPDVIIQVDLNDDQGWVCVISEGQPVSGYDKVVSREESVKLAFDAAQVYMQAQICSASIEGSGRTFDAFLENAPQTKAEYQGQMFPTPLVTKGRLMGLLILLAVAALSYGGHMGFELYQERQRAAERALAEQVKQDKLSAAEMERLEEERRLKVQEFRLRVEDARKAFSTANGGVALSMYDAWRRVITEMPASIVPRSLKKGVVCTPRSCVATWSLAGGRMLDRLELEAIGARLPGGDDSVESVMSASTIESEYPMPKFQPTSLGAAHYPATPLSMVDELRAMGEVFFPIPLQPVVVTGIPEMQIPDELIGHKQSVVVKTTGPFALQKVHDVLKKTAGIAVNWDMLRVEFESQYSIRQIELQGNILFAPEN